MGRKAVLVRNSGTATPKLDSGKFLSIAVHLKAAKVRHDQMNGRDHLVVPCVMMTEGVHEGSEGPLFYPKEELSLNTQLWNNKPVVVYHPTRNGAPVSACEPDIIDRYGVGVLMNTRWEGEGLKTECWMEEDKTRLVDNRVLDALDSEQVMEVSTGLFLDIEKTEGEWNGEAYKGIARNHRPDHLAILPDLEGACSVGDGAGLLRNAAKNGEDPRSRLASYHLAIVNKLSANELWREINDLLMSSVDQEAWAVDIWPEDGFFIYHDNSGDWYQKFEVQDKEVKFIGVRTAAEKETRYKLSDGTYVGNIAPANKETEMDPKERKKLVDKLIAHAKSPYTEEDRKQLMGMNEDHLKWVGNNLEEAKPEAKPAEPEAKPEAKPAEPTGNTQEPKEPTVEEFISKAPKGMQDMLRSGVAAHAAEKNRLIESITANERNPFSKEQLEAKDVTELKGLAVLAQVPQPDPVLPAPHFGGQAPVGHSQPGAAEEEPLVAPSINWDTK